MSLKNKFWNIFHLIYRGRRAKVTLADMQAAMERTEPPLLVPERHWRPMVTDWNRWSREHE